ncbi:MAG: acyltransferase family protein [Acaryochloridaceae cyanobacterium RU_4_10]|nr:acyltransferase family protein [Acaryochloridaceae cyanobacterium RU_4_10]
MRNVSELYLKAAQAPADTFEGWSLHDRNPRVIEQMMPWWEWLYHYYFRVKSDGWEHIPSSGKVLLVGSHNGGIAAPDMFMMMLDWYRRFGAERLVYGLMHQKVWQVFPDLARLAVQGGALRAHPKTAIAAFRQNASVLVYPGGIQDVYRPYPMRNKIHFNGRQGFIKLALREEVPIIPAIACGAHETFMVLVDVYQQIKVLNQMGLPWPMDIDPEVCPIYLGLPWGLAIGPVPHIPLPTSIQTRVCAPIVFERYGVEAAGDSEYVKACYDKVCQVMQAELDRLVEEVN